MEETRALCPIAKYVAGKEEAMPFWNKKTPDVAEADKNALLHPADPETIAQVQRLLRQIAAYEGAKRTAAEQALQDMGIEGALAIRALLEPKMQKQKKCERSQMWLSFLSFGGFWTFFIFMHIVLPMLPKEVRSHAALATLPIVTLVIVPLITQLLNSYSSPTSEIQILVRLRDKRTIPILLDVRRLVAGQTENLEINKALTNLLPTI